jgi:hypothetical protein
MPYFARLLALLLAHRRHLLWLLLLGVVLPWGIFLKASSEIEEGEGFYGDLQILRWAHAHARPALDSLSLFFTHIGGPVPMVVGAGLFTGTLVWRQRWPWLKVWYKCYIGCVGVLVSHSTVSDAPKSNCTPLSGPRRESRTRLAD